MDYIPFSSSEKQSKNSAPHMLKKSLTYSNGNSPNSHSKNFTKPNFGSPASFPSFGSPALSFGSPAVQNTSYSPLPRQASPKNFRQSTPMHGYMRGTSQDGFRPRNSSPSPRHTNSQSSFQFTPPQFVKRPQNNYQASKNNTDFKTPQHCFSPRGSNSGRKSFTRQFNQVVFFRALG